MARIELSTFLSVDFVKILGKGDKMHADSVGQYRMQNLRYLRYYIKI